MKSFFKGMVGTLILLLIVAVFGVFICLKTQWSAIAEENLSLLGKDSPILTGNGFQFRDLKSTA